VGQKALFFQSFTASAHRERFKADNTTPEDSVFCPRTLARVVGIEIKPGRGLAKITAGKKSPTAWDLQVGAVISPHTELPGP